MKNVYKYVTRLLRARTFLSILNVTTFSLNVFDAIRIIKSYTLRAVGTRKSQRGGEFAWTRDFADSRVPGRARSEGKRRYYVPNVRYFIKRERTPRTRPVVLMWFLFLFFFFAASLRRQSIRAEFRAERTRVTGRFSSHAYVFTPSWKQQSDFKSRSSFFFFLPYLRDLFSCEPYAQKKKKKTIVFIHTIVIYYRIGSNTRVKRFQTSTWSGRRYGNWCPKGE